MTVTQLAAEICSRAGEGYQNYTARALAHFKSAVLALLNTSMSPDVDAPGLCATFTDENYDSTGGILLSDIYTALDLSDAKILSIELKQRPLERITPQQYEVSKLRPELLDDNVWYYIYEGEKEVGGIIRIVSTMRIPPQEDPARKLVVRAIGWRAELSSTASNISIESYFSTNMLEKAIMLATEELKREIAA